MDISKTRKNDTAIIQSIDKALDILCCFSISEPEFGVTELATRLGMYKSTIFRTLKTLEQRGFVIQDTKTQKYRLGFKLFDLGNAVISGLEVRTVALPHMQELCSRTKETVTLDIADNGERVCIEKVEGTESVRTVVQIGLRHPLYIVAPGKLLLAYMPKEDVDRILSSKNLRGTALGKAIDVTALRKELMQITLQGYSFSNSERSIGTSAFAAPIRNHEGKVFAALGLSGPESRFDEERRSLLLRETARTANEISARLGWRGSPGL
ncbi:MAG: IclR family transcriptional regulator [Desulfitobacteriaceae bacterium]